MASTFGSFEIAKSGMMTYNAAIQTTAHNVANIETEGYSRQVTNRVSMVGNKSSLSVQGFGVEVSSISRQRSAYYDTKFQSTRSAYNKYDTEAHYLKAIQDVVCGNVVSEDKSLFGDAFDQFYAALSDLKGKPNNDTVRKKVVAEAQTFTSFVTNMATNLQKEQDKINSEIKGCVDQINAIADKLVSITKQINTVEAYGSVANDLRDQRSLLEDELSQYCNVKVEEIPAADGIGIPQYYVYINGGPLVDTYHTNKLEIAQKETYSNLGDIDGCYKVEWANGNTFNPYTNALGGKLQSLFEMRDGNNATTLQGKVSALKNNEEGNIVLTLSDSSINDVQKLNIPANDGEITINNRVYTYKEFSVEVDEDGSFTYEFVLNDVMDVADAKSLNIAMNKGYAVNVGTPVNVKGIPYYMSQLNEFVRTFAQEFNTVQNQGHDLYDNMGIDFFNATVQATGDDFIFTERTDGKDVSFTSLAKQNDDGTYTGSYYYITALNFTVTKEIVADTGLLACKEVKADGQSVGNDNGENLQRLLDLKDKSTMFVHGAPDDFIQSLSSTLGVNTRKAVTLAKSQSDLMYAIDTNRKSISGVDEDEEGADLIIFQNMLSNQFKVLSVMNEVLDKLINQTAV